MKKISNPLTIIGMFAGIAEVSGTIVLPFVSHELQSIFIWYVMVFPVLLVAIFFITLNFNRNALYAPSDFDDETNFMILSKKMKKIDSSIEEVKSKNPNTVIELEKVQMDIRQMVKNTFDRKFVILDLIKKSKNGITAKELADQLNMTRPTISRYLMEMSVEGLIDVEEEVAVGTLKRSVYIYKAAE